MIQTAASYTPTATWPALPIATSAPPPWTPGTRKAFRIAFVITRADAVGGASIHVRDVCQYLIRCGHEATVFLGGTGAVTQALETAGVPFHVVKGLVRNINPKADLLACWNLRRALKAFNPDLVSCHTSKAGVIGRVTAKSLGIPSIYTPHCWSFVDGFPGAKFYLWAERLARPFGNRIIMVSEAERQDGLSHRVAGPRHLVTVPNGMPDIPVRLRANPGAQPVRIVMVGRFEAQKDHSSLLQAMASMRDLNWVLDLVGDGPQREAHEKMARDLGIADRVNFLRYRKDVAEILSSAQIFTLITHWEGFPRSIIEAMRAGLPVVATAVGGNAESVAHGRTGFIVPHRDVDDIAFRLRQLIESSDLRTTLGTAGRLSYERSFTLERMVKDTIKVWSDVLELDIAFPLTPAPVEQRQEAQAVSVEA